MKTLLETECIPKITQLADVLADWYKVAQTAYLQARILGKDLLNSSRKMEEFVARHPEVCAAALNKLHSCIEQIPSKMDKTPASAAQDLLLLHALREYPVIDNELEALLHTNNSMLRSLHDLLL